MPRTNSPYLKYGYCKKQNDSHMKFNGALMITIGLRLINAQMGNFTVAENSTLDISGSWTTAEKHLISYYLMGITTMLICWLGAIANILCLIVLIKRTVGSPTTNLYLIALAVADFLVLVSTIFTVLKDTRKPIDDQMFVVVWYDLPIIPRIFPFFHSTAILFQVTSVWLTVAFTTDRYLMICHPFWAKRWCTVRTTKVIIVILYMTSILYGIPRYFEYENVEIFVPVSPKVDELLPENASLLQIPDFQKIVWYDLSELGRSAQFVRHYHLASWNILVVAIPFVSIAVMNSFLISEVRKSSRKDVKAISTQASQYPQNDQQSDGTMQRKQRRQDTDVMLIGVIAVFFVCQTPAAISHFIWEFKRNQLFEAKIWYLLNEIGNLLIVINSAINLFLYYLFSRRFRKHFTQIFCPYRIIRDNGLHCAYIPRWMVERWDNENSDQYCSTMDGWGPRRSSARLVTYHRRMSIPYNHRPSVQEPRSSLLRSRFSGLNLAARNNGDQGAGEYNTSIRQGNRPRVRKHTLGTINYHRTPDLLNPPLEVIPSIS